MASTNAARTVAALHREIVSLDSYAASPRVNALFRRLVERVLRGEGSLGLSPEETDELRTACARAERRLEDAWSRRVAAADDPRAALGRFPYLDNYRRLARMEAEGVRDHLGATPERAVFVGGGPLPLSALRLAESHGWTVEVVERDSDAAAAARGAVAALGVDLPVREADGAAVDYGGYDLVHVAALVDPDGADGVFDRVHDTADDGALLLGRSAHGRRRALYPALPDRVHERFDHLTTRRPPGDVINSAVFFRA